MSWGGTAGQASSGTLRDEWLIPIVRRRSRVVRWIRMSMPALSPRRFVRQAILFEGSLALVAAALGWLLPTPPWRQIHWTWTAAAYGAAAALPLLAAMFALHQLRAGPFGRLNRVVDQLIVPLFAGCSLADFALISLVAGFGEELLFRGLVQTALIGWFGVAAGVALASLLFGLAHIITPTYALLAAAIGIYFGWLALYSNDLLAPIVAHAVYDFAALVYLTHRARHEESAVFSHEGNNHELHE
jgi:membrane protease YdiL (CAAX protease family)